MIEIIVIRVVALLLAVGVVSLIVRMPVTSVPRQRRTRDGNAYSLTTGREAQTGACHWNMSAVWAASSYVCTPKLRTIE